MLLGLEQSKILNLQSIIVLPGVLRCRPLRRTVQVRHGFDLGFGISDLGFINTIDDIEINSSDIAICSLVLTNFSASFHSAFRNRRPGGTPVFFALASLRSGPQAGSQLRSLATAIHQTTELG